MTKTRLLAVAVVLCLPVFTPTAVGAATASVSIVDFAFTPFERNINVGDEVLWTNTAGSTHTVTSFTVGTPPFDSGNLSPSATYKVTFNSAGEFPYFCQIHLGMQGIIKVAGPASSTVINPTTIEPGDSFTASATGVSSANSSYVLRLGTNAENCPTGLALGGARNSDANFNIPAAQRVMPTNATSGARWLCWVRTGTPSDRSPPTQVTIV